MVADYATIAFKVLEIFGERDPEKRTKAIRESFTEDTTFADAEEVVIGWEGLDRKVKRLQEQAPEFVFTPVGEVRVVHNMTILSWQLGTAGAAPVVTGTDICLIEDGRIKCIYTLLGAALEPGQAAQ